MSRIRTLGTAFALTFAAVSVPHAAAQSACATWQPGFGAPGPDRPFTEFVVHDDGTGPALYACGPFRAIGNEPARGVVRWDGARWTPLGGGLYDVDALVVHDDGTGSRLVAAGRFTAAAGAVGDWIASWDGAQWSPIPGLAPTTSPTNNPGFLDLASIDDGGGPALYVAGWNLSLAATSTAVAVARHRAGAWSDASAGLAAGVEVRALHRHDLGGGARLYAGLASSGALLARWEGTAWTDVAPALAGGAVQALTSYAGALAVAHDAQTAPVPGPGVALFDGASVQSLGPPLVHSYATPRVLALGTHDFGAGPRLVVAGRFQGAGTLRSLGLIAWNGVGWESVGPQPGPEFVSIDTAQHAALASFVDAGGPALAASGPGSNYGGTPAAWAARLRGGTWSPFTRGDGLVSVAAANTSGLGFDLAVVGTGTGARLAVAGAHLRGVGGELTPSSVALLDDSGWTALSVPGAAPLWAKHVVEVDLGAGPSIVVGGNRIGGFASGVARWTSTGWEPLGVLPSVAHLVAFDDGSGPTLAASPGSQSQGSGVVRWNGSTWVALGGGAMHIEDLCAHDDGSGTALYVVGDFVVGSGPTQRGIARWNGTSWVPVGASTLASLTGARPRLASLDLGAGPRLYVAGTLTVPFAGTQQLCVWDGVAWTPIATPPVTKVWSLGVLHDGVAPRLAAGFTANSPTSYRVALLQGSDWVTIGTSDAPIEDLATLDLDGNGVPELYAVGSFREIDGVPASNLARYAPCGTSAHVVCAGDGSGAACPCGNVGASGSGCANSVFAAGASLGAGGLASLSNDTLRLDAHGLTGTFALAVQSTSSAGGGAGVPFGDGLACADGVVLRLASAAVANGAARVPAAGGASLAQLGAVTQPGTTRTYQFAYRNQAAFCTSSATNATNGLVVTWTH